MQRWKNSITTNRICNLSINKTNKVYRKQAKGKAIDKYHVTFNCIPCYKFNCQFANLKEEKESQDWVNKDKEFQRAISW